MGLQEQSEGEACWWTIHPSSKQRSEGEKVRVGDDAILVSVATERYLVNDFFRFDLLSWYFLFFKAHLTTVVSIRKSLKNGA